MNNEIVYKKLNTCDEIVQTKDLIVEYMKWLNADVCFQNIEDELNNFPENYKNPDGDFLIAKENNTVIGCVGIQKIDENIGEMKRLFVTKKYQGKGIGKRLVENIIEEAKKMRCRIIRLDTLKIMEKALGIYYKIGFYEIKPDYNNPYDDVLHLEMKI